MIAIAKTTASRPSGLVRRRRQGAKEPKEPPAARQIRARVTRLGITLVELAAAAGIAPSDLNLLLMGRRQTSRALGYDRWPDTLGAILDRYEQAWPIVRRHAENAVAELQIAGLPVPDMLLDCLRQRSRRYQHGGLRRGAGRKPSSASAHIEQAAPEVGA